MLVPVAGEVAVVAVDHRQAGPMKRVRSKVRCWREARRSQRCGEDRRCGAAGRCRRHAARFATGTAGSDGRRVATTFARNDKWRLHTRARTIDGVEPPCLKRNRSLTRLGLRQLELAPRERAANLDDPLVAVDVALLERDPLCGTKASRGREQDHRPIALAEPVRDRLNLCHDSNGHCSFRRGVGLSTPTLAGLMSIIPHTTALPRTCRSACAASKR